MICAIMQPTYMPWLGYFNMIQQVDTFVFLDSVQLEKRSWQVRNRIKGPDGEVLLTIPIKSGETTRICDVQINNEHDWKRKHLRAMECYYSKASAFQEVYPTIKSFYKNTNISVGDFNVKVISYLCNQMGIRTHLYCSSELGIVGTKDDLLADICLKIGANEYLSAKGSLNYINRNNLGGAFVKKGVKLFYFDYEHPIYAQQFGNFVPYMGIFDLLFNVGFEFSKEIITSGTKAPISYNRL